MLMANTATSLRLPKHLKARIERLSRRAGVSTHAFMLRALEGHVTAEERYQEFLSNGVRADEAMQRSRLGYSADDVHAYVATLARRRTARRPRPVRWRK